jgi:hypothetical protein
VSQVQAIGARAVVGRQQPEREARRDFMEGRAGGGTRVLLQLRPDVAPQPPFEYRRGDQHVREVDGRDAERAAFAFHACPHRRGTQAHHEWGAHHPLGTHQIERQGTPALHVGEKRDEPVGREIHPAHELRPASQHLVLGEHNALTVFADVFALRGRQRREQVVAVDE